MAAAFRTLHESPPLLLPNAWDAASAAAIESGGAAAIATTSAGIAWARGTTDGEQLGRDRMLQALTEIVAAVRAPVTADIESGYGVDPDDVAVTIRALIGIGVAGINIEDSPGADGPLRAPSIQAARIGAVRATADRAGVPLWINARTDVFLTDTGALAELLRETGERAAVYAAAGADSLFVPGVADLGVIRDLTAGPLPINVMVGSGSPDGASLAQAGVARVSLGPAIAQAAYGLATRATRELLHDGTYTALDDPLARSH
ncbi:MAG TPA: isocitrate lyase/phosphoenolpyruvate mutase family protein [Kribbella sp.]|nr:isocitrate lyase/phosphoenolpyruvate mutase family protein [Kribbella sp.]